MAAWSPFGVVASMLACVSVGVPGAADAGVVEWIVCARLLELGTVGDDTVGPSACSALIDLVMLVSCQ